MNNKGKASGNEAIESGVAVSADSRDYSRNLTKLILMEGKNGTMQSWGGICLEETFENYCSKYRGSETILLVDDQVDLVRLLESVLTESGYNVIPAYDGQHAVETFKEHIDSIDIILMDIIMPRKDGVKAYLEISTMKPDVNVVFMSGFPSDIFGELNKQIDLIVKPFMPYDIVKKIREKLDQAHQTSKAQP